MIKKYICKDTERYEAMQLKDTRESLEEAWRFVGKNVNMNYAVCGICLHVVLDGITTTARPGHYIIKREEGRFEVWGEKGFEDFFDVLKE
jgi:hypothetical protein